MLSSPSTSNWTKVSPLEVLITRACEPSLPEPNYALHLEVADYINQKKANSPREAAMFIARLVNNRNPHISILSLSLLDTLVQSCGYPFHLQISTKEFLNELVRRFPERPPPFPGPVMSRILELIHGWKEGLCQDSRWKEDLGNIRDMHRLLTFKGYRFRDIPRRGPTTAATANLKTAEELEDEDREAQSAKLQELIRRGTPRDLAAAQELMKSLAGANPDAKPDYKSQALNDLNKLEQNVILLNEVLDNVDTERGEKFVSGDVYDQVASSLTAARPKLQKWISDAESHDPESLDTYLQINDQINTVMNRYEAYKKGDYTVAANPIPKELSSQNEPVSLIDFDDSQSAANQGASSGPDDLAGLFGSSTQAPMNPMMGAINMNMVPAMSMGATTPLMNNMGMMGMGGMSQPSNSIPTHAPSPMMFNGNNNLFGNKSTSVSPPQGTGTPPASIMLPHTPMGGSPVPAAPNYYGQTGPTGPSQLGNGMGGSMGMMGMTNAAAPSMGMGVGMPAMQPQIQPQQTQPLPTQASQTSGKDPFADLAGLF